MQESSGPIVCICQFRMPKCKFYENTKNIFRRYSYFPPFTFLCSDNYLKLPKNLLEIYLKLLMTTQTTHPSAHPTPPPPPPPPGRYGPEFNIKQQRSSILRLPVTFTGSFQDHHILTDYVYVKNKAF